jgi:hypothetical protein
LIHEWRLSSIIVPDCANRILIAFLTLRANFWSTLSIVMHRFSANTKTHTGIRGAISISIIRISGHNARAGNGA